MDERKDLDAWADDLLDQHRTAPRGSAAAARDRASSADDPLALRLMTKLSGEPPDPHMRERYLRQRERHAAFQRIEGPVMLVATVALVALGAIWLTFL